MLKNVFISRCGVLRPFSDRGIKIAHGPPIAAMNEEIVLDQSREHRNRSMEILLRQTEPALHV